jgi:hypothetical protein
LAIFLLIVGRSLCHHPNIVDFIGTPLARSSTWNDSLSLTIGFFLFLSSHQGRARLHRISVWSPSTTPTEA